ncbi:hypothetical protein AB0C84_35785 [Actinomadura sp. NPDC048955]|uniref:hypothetical protein n=1 Tax=Actinomadura sp. NPDC048955 TaxID=3158228 RepID=UPI0033C5987C
MCGNNPENDVRVPALLGIRALLLGPAAARSDLPPRTNLIEEIGELPELLTGRRTSRA